MKHWPSGIFRRAFIRAYADAIGLQPDEIVREFLALYPDPIEVVSIGAALETSALAKRRPPTRFQYLMGNATEWMLTKCRDAFAQRTQSPAPAVPAPPMRLPIAYEVDLMVAAHLCTKLGQADRDADIAPLLRDAAKSLDAIGLIVWRWEPETGTLTPCMADGYSERVLSQLPTVHRDADNATAAAFRSGQVCAVSGADGATSALAVPVMAPSGCVGVLAIELQNGAEQSSSIRAVALIFAAQIGRVVDASSAARSERAPSARRRA